MYYYVAEIYPRVPKREKKALREVAGATSMAGVKVFRPLVSKKTLVKAKETLSDYVALGAMRKYMMIVKSSKPIARKLHAIIKVKGKDVIVAYPARWSLAQ